MKRRYFATECIAEYVALHIVRERRGRGVTRANNCESPWREAANGGQLQGLSGRSRLVPPIPLRLTQGYRTQSPLTVLLRPQVQTIRSQVQTIR